MTAEVSKLTPPDVLTSPTPDVGCVSTFQSPNNLETPNHEMPKIAKQTPIPNTTAINHCRSCHTFFPWLFFFLACLSCDSSTVLTAMAKFSPVGATAWTTTSSPNGQ